MKVRLLTLLAIIFLLGNVSSAQGVGAYKAKKTEVVKVKNNNLAPQRQGFYVMPEVGVGMARLNRSNSEGSYRTTLFSFVCILGYEFNNQLNLSFESGININVSYAKSIPIIFNIGGDLSKRTMIHNTDIIPYYNIGIGYLHNIQKIIGGKRSYHGEGGCGNHNNSAVLSVGWDHYYYYYDNGFLISPEIGLRFNNCYLGIKCLISRRHEDSETYHYHDSIFYEYTYESSFNSSITNILSLKFGYKIPLNLKH